MTTILCIDDDPDFLQVLSSLLNAWGYRTVLAENGARGLERMLECDPAMVICDRRMSGMSGSELLSRLRESYPQFDRTPFVFLTALADRRDRHAVADLGSALYLTKPVDFDVLKTWIQGLVTADSGGLCRTTTCRGLIGDGAADHRSLAVQRAGQRGSPAGAHIGEPGRPTGE